MSERQRASSLGATGGLPGANAAPQASELTVDELEDTVATGDVPTTPVDPALGLDADTVVDVQAGRRPTPDDDAPRQQDAPRQEGS